MGIPVFILGESGSGKSASLRNMNPDETVVLNVASKPLPFRKKFPYTVNGATYKTIYKALDKYKDKYKRYVIDDSQYLIAFDFFDHANEKGYEKFTALALQFTTLLRFVISNTPDDCIVYFLHHTETTDAGKVKAKTIGRMLDEKLTVEGLCSIVLLAVTDGKEHKFITQSDGMTTAKSPMGMFDTEIDNDLEFVDKTIREYYEFK